MSEAKRRKTDKKEKKETAEKYDPELADPSSGEESSSEEEKPARTKSPIKENASLGASAYELQHEWRRLNGNVQQQGIQRPRVYVGNIPFWITEQEITQIFSAFGTVTGINMPRDGMPPQTKGYCFVEYVEPAAVSNAIASLQGFVLGGRVLKVNQPTQQRSPQGLSGVIAVPVAAPQGGLMRSIAVTPTAAAVVPGVVQLGAEVTPSAPAAPVVQQETVFKPPSAPVTSKVLCLENMVGPGEADDDLADEVGEECGNFGKVKRVTVQLVGKKKEVRVLVTFKEIAGVEKAIANMNGRFFGGRQVRAAPYKEES